MKVSLYLCAAIAAMCVLSINVALAQAEATTTAEVELTYRVLPGDNLVGVARDFGLEPQAIIDANTSHEGVFINHCGTRPRRVRVNEATPARCTWLRSGVDITIPRVEAPAPPLRPEETEEPNFSSSEEEMREGIATMSKIGEEWPRMRSSIYSLHQKIDRQREETRNLSQKNGEISFILKVSLTLNVKSFLP